MFLVHRHNSSQEGEGPCSLPMREGGHGHEIIDLRPKGHVDEGQLGGDEKSWKASIKHMLVS